jgi:hypothetical protein
MNAKMFMLVFFIILFGSMLVYHEAKTPNKEYFVIEKYESPFLYTPRSELNGLSLYEVFEEGLIDLFSSSWSTAGLKGGLQYYDDYIMAEKGNVSQFAVYKSTTQINLILGNKYYYKLHIEMSYEELPNLYEFSFRTSTSNIDSKIIINTNDLIFNYNESIIFEYTKNDSSAAVLYYLSGIEKVNTNYTYLKIFKDNYLYDLTSLGIDNLTVSQLDYWYEKYVYYKNKNDEIDIYKFNMTDDEMYKLGHAGLTGVLGVPKTIEAMLGPVKKVADFIISGDWIITIGETTFSSIDEFIDTTKKWQWWDGAFRWIP